MATGIKQLQNAHLLALAESPSGFEFTDTFFPYTSAEIGPYYVQSAAIMHSGIKYQRVCSDMGCLVRRAKANCEGAVISGGESRDWIFSFPIAIALGLPPAMIYKDGKVLGADMNGRKVVHIADLNNEGSSPRDLWVPAIQGAGGTIEDIFFYVDRMESGVQVMEELGLQRHALVELDAHAWNYLKEIDVVSEEVYRNLQERGTTKEQRDVWARKMLRSDRGFETLVKLLADFDQKTRDKGWKILDKGYPDMKEELMDRFKQNGFEFSR